MKRFVIIIVNIAMALSLVACVNTTQKPTIYIEKAQLTEQEESIAELLGANSEQLIFDFKLDNNVKSIQVNTYELVNGEWNLISGGGGRAFADNKGRLALDFENLAEELRIALQSEHSSGSTQYSTEPIEDFTGMTQAASFLNDIAEIVYEQEIPLVIQILTTQNSVSTYNVESFYTPDKYEKHGYEHVYAITIKFSQKTVSELNI